MWQENLEKIRQEEATYGEELNDGISEQEAAEFVKEVKKVLKMPVPEDYLKILKVINGIENNGIILYGVDEALLKNKPKRHVNGLIDNNQDWLDNEWDGNYLFLGDGNISWYVYDVDNKKYYELDQPSGDICYEFDSFELMFDKMLEDSLT